MTPELTAAGFKGPRIGFSHVVTLSSLLISQFYRTDHSQNCQEELLIREELHHRHDKSQLLNLTLSSVRAVLQKLNSGNTSTAGHSDREVKA
jgi:alpha-amylase/alpha-mannosidase (GH57 family)